MSHAGRPSAYPPLEAPDGTGWTGELPDHAAPDEALPAGRPARWRRLGLVGAAVLATVVLIIFGPAVGVLVPLLSGGPKTGSVGIQTPGVAVDESAPPSDPAAQPTPTPQASRSASPPPSASATAANTARLEDAVVALVNRERAKTRCQPVHADPRLRTAARQHSADMATRGFFSHTGTDRSSPSERMRRAGYPQGLSENIALGFASAQAVVQGWMRSPSHRRNVLDCAAHAVGVGLAYGGSRPYWTQDFGRV